MEKQNPEFGQVVISPDPSRLAAGDNHVECQVFGGPYDGGIGYIPKSFLAGPFFTAVAHPLWGEPAVAYSYDPARGWYGLTHCSAAHPEGVPVR